jgi:ATP-dependent DNA helicase DinG
VVMEGIPWPRPTVLHAARRAVALRQAQDERGGSAYDDRVVRARLAQAFGRLIRRQEDRGLFVLLSAAAPSRLMTAFPPGVAVRRLPLAEATQRVNEWLSSGQPIRHEERV